MVNPFAVLACPDCGMQNLLHFDASTLMERQFEGVMFLIRQSDNADGFVVTGDPKDTEYLEDFNMKKHIRDATEMVREAIREGDLAPYIYCPKCSGPLG